MHQIKSVLASGLIRPSESPPKSLLRSPFCHPICLLEECFQNRKRTRFNSLKGSLTWTYAGKLWKLISATHVQLFKVGNTLNSCMQGNSFHTANSAVFNVGTRSLEPGRSGTDTSTTWPMFPKLDQLYVQQNEARARLLLPWRPRGQSSVYDAGKIQFYKFKFKTR